MLGKKSVPSHQTETWGVRHVTQYPIFKTRQSIVLNIFNLISSLALVSTDACFPDTRPPYCLIQCETRPSRLVALWDRSFVVGGQLKDNAIFLIQIAFLVCARRNQVFQSLLLCSASAACSRRHKGAAPAPGKPQ